MRIGARDDYTRIVFGWPEAVTYNIEQSQEGAVRIAFNKPAQASFEGDNLKALNLIHDMSVASNAPLTVQFKIPSSSKIRELKVGKRVIFDIYKPSNPKDLIAFKAQAQEDVPKEPEKQEAVKAAPKETTAPPEPKVDVPKVAEKKSANAPPAVPPSYVLVPETLPAIQPEEKTHEHEGNAHDDGAHEVEQKKKESLAKAVKQDNHVFSIRSTQALPVAVFVHNNDMFWVVGDTSSFLVPNLSTPSPKLFSEIERVSSNDKVTLYKMKMPSEDFPMMARGGGLVWDLIMGDKIKEKRPIQPIRTPIKTNSIRGGSLIWPFENVNDIVEVTDPITGQIMKVVMVNDSVDFAGASQSYIDFDVLFSPIGLTIYPKVDDLRVEKTDQGVEISRPNGLALALKADVEAAKIFMDRHSGKQKQHHDAPHEDASDDHGDAGHQKKVDGNNLFKFNQWQLGSKYELEYNENLLLDGLHAKTDALKVQDTLAIGKMFLSHGRGAEALGYFEYALADLPGLLGSPEFHALRGVARALDWKTEDALEDFLHRNLKDQDEIKFWTSYVLADLGDWQQAISVLPKDYKALHSYPPNIAIRLALVLAEVNLRDGKVNAAKELMSIAAHHKDHMLEPFKASYKYLQGEAARQNGDTDTTKEVWKKLTVGKDDLFRTKAGLALTILQSQKGEISNEEAIDRLEHLRYAWRGDELEAQINYWLGDAYFKEQDFIKGLSIMRDAVSFAEQGALAGRITSDMARTFSDLFLGPALKDVSPLDAVAVYEQFSELTPVGAQGDKLVQNLAEHLVRADLLGRATKLLQYQVDHRLKGEEKLRIAIRLAAIQLIDKKPQKAINSLSKAEDTMRFLSETPKKEQYQREIDILRVRAYSQNKQYDKALKLLENLPIDKNTSRLRADISWQAGFWNEAADALNTVIIEENIPLNKPLTDAHASLILNRAIALSLDSDRIALANMREKYNKLMGQSQKANQFEVITRPRRNSGLADRETLLSSVAEVDLFGDFLESYKDANN